MEARRHEGTKCAGTQGLRAYCLATFAMGTRFELVLHGEDDRHLRAVGEEAIAEIEYLHEKFSYFSNSSIVTRINERAAYESVNLDRETFDLLSVCREVWQSSGGAFDITVAPLMRRWGFRNQPLAASRDRMTGEGAFGMKHVVLDQLSRTIRFTLPEIELDLGGIAKGYALDRAAAILREYVIKSALIHGGTSTAIAIGAPPEQDAWRIRIHDEIEPLTISLRDAALSVSAPRRRTVTHHDQTHGHIIDPRTGEPASNSGNSGGATTAAVIAPIPGGATLADAWSTALLVLNARPSAMPDSFDSMIRDDLRGWRCDGASEGRAPLRVAAKRAD